MYRSFEQENSQTALFFGSIKTKKPWLMLRSTPVNENPMIFAPRESGQSLSPTVTPLIVLVATVDSEISKGMCELLEMYPVRTFWVQGVEEVRALLTRERVTACFCGFWLVDGTYRDVVRHLKRQRVEIPAVIVCAPACAQEYRDYLAALNIRAFDFICHPYRKSDLERILRAAIWQRFQVSLLPSSIESVMPDPEIFADLRPAG